MTRKVTITTMLLALACLTPLAGLTGAANAESTKVRLALAPTGAEAEASGKLQLVVRSRATELSGKLKVEGRHLLPLGAYEITVDGVRIGSFITSMGGTGRARFRTVPRSRDQLLGVDPRGRSLEILDDTGAVVLITDVPVGGVGGWDPDKVRCCLPDDSGTECEDRTAAECSALGGTDLGPGSCLPNPCQDGAPAPDDDIRCCLPDDSGPECEDRTAAECSALGGINLGAGSCLPNPCPPVQPAPDDDIRCCLPDDSGTECEDRTAAECSALGGVNIGAGSCLPNPCQGGTSTSTTSTSLPDGTSTTTTTLFGGTPVVEVTCERRSDRSKISVNGRNLASGSYLARVTSGANTADGGPLPTIGDEVEFDFASQPDDIAAGATPIAAGFIQGNPAQVTGEILTQAGELVAEATVSCLDR